MVKVKDIIKYLLLFIFFLLILIFFGNNQTDVIWNYGMAHAIRCFEVPYLDFNIITTPLYAFIMSIGLFISDSYLTFLIEQAILCTVLVYFYEKLVGSKYYLLLPIMCFPIFYFILPNYNFLVYLLIIIIMFCDINSKNDKCIGILLGLLILSKHTIGICILLFSMISTFNIRKSSVRLVYSLIPVGIFIIYLLCTQSFMSFIDLSILGLFDFSEHNKYISIIGIVFLVITIIYIIISIKKDYKDITSYYLLGSISFVIPIIDMFHLYYLFNLFMLVLMIKHFNFTKRYSYIIGSALLLIIIMLNISNNISFYREIKLNDYNHMRYLLFNKDGRSYTYNILKKYNSYDNSYMISINSMFFDIESERKITYLGVPLYGNFGYNGLDKMKKKIRSMHDVYFFVLDNDNRQFASELVNTVRECGKLVDSVEGMDIYYLE